MVAQRLHRVVDTLPLESFHSHRTVDDMRQQQARGGEVIAVDSSGPLLDSTPLQTAPDSLVNGFVCEVPVVLDVGRLHDLVSALDSTTTQKLTDNFRGAVLRVRARLHTYLKDIMVPPKLPSILFGIHDASMHTEIAYRLLNRPTTGLLGLHVCIYLQVLYL